MPITIRPAQSAEDRQGCYDVRMTVFVEEQRVPVEEELDSYDEIADHFVAEEDGRVVGTARLIDRGDGTGKIGRVAILPDYRGRGLGRDLMWYVMAAAFQRFDTLMLDAQVPVIPFYERLGFEAEGGVFLDAGIEHRKMTCRR